MCAVQFHYILANCRISQKQASSFLNVVTSLLCLLLLLLLILFFTVQYSTVQYSVTGYITEYNMERCGGNIPNTVLSVVMRKLLIRVLNTVMSTVLSIVWSTSTGMAQTMAYSDSCRLSRQRQTIKTVAIFI